MGVIAPLGEHELRRETAAARTLLASLREMGMDDDAELVADSVEGETKLTESVEWALGRLDENDALVIGLKTKEAAFADRRHRIEQQSERLRALIEQALVMMDGGSLRLSSGTLTLRKLKPALVIDGEADIPSEFFTPVPQPPPGLDKEALRAALAAGRIVPGAHLGNGGVSLSIRRK